MARDRNTGSESQIGYLFLFFLDIIGQKAEN